MLKLETKADLQRLIDEQIQESLTLDYKASPALRKLDRQRDELCKDVTAFANSAGGQIIFGIEEDKHVPTKIDDGAEPAITKEWIEQVIDSRGQPRIEGLIISPIQLAKGLGFVLTIPQASGRAPHQAPDNKYYKRQNFQSVPMEDYEIRDILRRATIPELSVQLALLGGNPTPLKFASKAGTSNPFPVIVSVRNLSPQPAFHATIDVFVEADIEYYQSDATFENLGTRGDSPPMRMLRWVFHSPPALPIFQEEDEETHRAEVALRWPMSATQGEPVRIVETVVRAPGFKKSEHWLLHLRAGLLSLHSPDSQFTRTYRLPPSRQ